MAYLQNLTSRQLETQDHEILLMPRIFPTEEQWNELAVKTLKQRFRSSTEWDNLDAAVRAYARDQGNDALFQNLKTATEAFVAVKTRADGVFETTRDSNGSITALRAYVADNPPLISEEATEAAKEIIRANKQALFRTLTTAEIRYKSAKKLEMAKSLAEDASEFKDSLMEIPQVASAAESVQGRIQSSLPSFGSSTSSVQGGASMNGLSSTVSGALPSIPGNVGAQAAGLASQMSGSMFKMDWDRIIRDICSVGEAIPDIVIHEIKEIIGRQLFDAISSAIPYLGTIKEGAAVMNHLKTIAMHEVNTLRVKSARVYTRPGDVQAAINAVIQMLNSERVDLGIDLAGSSATFAAGIGTLGADGGAVQVITSVAVTGAKLIRTIHSFVADHLAMTKTNKMLKSAAGANMPLLETLISFPLLGAYVISTLETSTILELNIMDINQPFFKFLTEHNNKKIETIRTSAVRILEESRFEITQTEQVRLDEIRKRQAFASSLQLQLEEALARRNMNAVIRDIPAAAAKFQERREARAAHVAKFTPIAQEAASKLSLLEIMLLANMELEREMAALIDIRAMREQREAEITRNKALAARVQTVLETYKSQTSGFRALITSQSDESTAAIAAMNSLITAQTYGDLNKFRQLVEYLLKVSSRLPEGLNPSLRQLKNPSRLHGLLSPAYQSWATTAR
jgi:hypothetical protein